MTVTAIAAALELLETRGCTVLSRSHASPLYGAHMRGRHVIEHAVDDRGGCTETEWLVLVRGWVLVSLPGRMLRVGMALPHHTRQRLLAAVHVGP